MEEPETVATLLDLPDTILINIFKQVTLRDLFGLRRLNVYLRNFLDAFATEFIRNPVSESKWTITRRIVFGMLDDEGGDNTALDAIPSLAILNVEYCIALMLEILNNGICEAKLIFHQLLCYIENFTSNVIEFIWLSIDYRDCDIVKGRPNVLGFIMLLFKATRDYRYAYILTNITGYDTSLCEAAAGRFDIEVVGKKIESVLKFPYKYVANSPAKYVIRYSEALSDYQLSLDDHEIMEFFASSASINGTVRTIIKFVEPGAFRSTKIDPTVLCWWLRLIKGMPYSGTPKVSNGIADGFINHHSYNPHATNYMTLLRKYNPYGLARKLASTYEPFSEYDVFFFFKMLLKVHRITDKGCECASNGLLRILLTVTYNVSEGDIDKLCRYTNAEVAMAYFYILFSVSDRGKLMLQKNRYRPGVSLMPLIRSCGTDLSPLYTLLTKLNDNRTLCGNCESIDEASRCITTLKRKRDDSDWYV